MRRFVIAASVIAVVATVQGTASAQPAPAAGNLAFTGEWRSADGLIYLRGRVYHPRLRRFMQRDDVTGAVHAPMSTNRYTYVEGNPATWTDPSGHQAQKDADDRPFWETWRGLRDAVAGAITQTQQGMRNINPLAKHFPQWYGSEAADMAALARFGVNVEGDNFSDGGTIINSAIAITGVARGVVGGAVKGAGRAGSRVTRWFTSRTRRAIPGVHPDHLNLKRLPSRYRRHTLAEHADRFRKRHGITMDDPLDFIDHDAMHELRYPGNEIHFDDHDIDVFDRVRGFLSQQMSPKEAIDKAISVGTLDPADARRAAGEAVSVTAQIARENGISVAEAAARLNRGDNTLRIPWTISAGSMPPMTPARTSHGLPWP
jgi:RHS repeat-associated protein